MATIIDSLSEQFSAADVSRIAEELGVNDETTRKAIGAALPGLIAALSRAAEDPETGGRLAEAVNQHSQHSDGLLDQLGSLFKKFTQPEGQPDEGVDLGRLIPDLLGGRQQRVEKGVSQTSGINPQVAEKLLKVLGPIVIGVIAKQLSGKHVDAATVNGHLNQEREQLERQHGDLLGRLFDQDGDGDFDMSDIASVISAKMTGN